MSKIEDISNMKNSDFVSYPIAVKLKACGFDEPCDSYYDKACASDDEYWYTKREEAYNWNGLDSDCQISAPSLYAAQKWLREKRKMYCQVIMNGVRSMYFWQVTEMIYNGRYADSNHQYDVYEDAMSDCISAALELIKKGE